MAMIPARTTRRMTLNGQNYAKGEPLSLAQNQFDDLGPEGIGWVERARPVRKSPAAKPAEDASRSDPEITD